MVETKIFEPLLEIDEVLDILSDISIFAGLNDSQLYELFRLLKKVTYNKGEIVFEQGGEPSYIYVVKSGLIKLVSEQKDTKYELVVFGRGNCFGEASVIGIQPHAATAIAVEESELIVLSRNTLLSLYKSNLQMFSILIMNIAREVCRRLHKSDEVLLHYIR